MKFFGCFNIFVMSVFNFFKKSKIIIFPIRFYMRLPFFSLFMPRNTFKPAFVCCGFLDIFHILTSICQTQIRNSIIITNPINMVKFIFWPFFIVYCPCDSMSSHKYIINPYKNVSRFIFTCYYIPRFSFSTLNAPKKCASFRIVGKKFLGSLYRYMCHKGNMVTWPVAVNIMPDGRY